MLRRGAVKMATGEQGGTDMESISGVLLPSTMVGGDGFTTAVGRTTRLALLIECGSWTSAGEPDGAALVGEVLPSRSEWAGGWMLNAGGLTFYVLPASESDKPPPAGSLVRVEGQLGIAEDYITELFEPRDDLRARAVRTWQVHRIVRLGNHSRRDVQVVSAPDPGARGYLLDLSRAGWHAGRE